MKRFLCRIGIHKWATREIHQEEDFDDHGYAKADVIDRCECGQSRFAIGGDTRKTCWVISSRIARPWKA